MTDSNNLTLALSKEAERIEEDSIHSAKGHFNASDIWRCRHYWLGIPATILGALAGAAIVKDWTVLASLLSLAATILTALVTFLKPTERASEHKTVGDQYLALKNDARVFREIELLVQDLIVPHNFAGHGTSILLTCVHACSWPKLYRRNTDANSFASRR